MGGDLCAICHQPHARNQPHVWPMERLLPNEPQPNDRLPVPNDPILMIKLIESGRTDTFDPACPCCVEAKRRRDAKMAKARAGRKPKQ